ncbi:MAG: diacylglycerol kinase family protein [Kordiimonas sp.]
MRLEKSQIESGASVPLVAILSNPLSTTNAGGMEEIRKVVNESANVVHFELNGIETIDEAMALFGRASPALLVINGGDGTIGAAFASLLYNKHFRVIPPIAILPGGKTNMTAADLGAKGKPIKVLKRLLKLAKRGEVADHLTSRHVIEMDLGDGKTPRVGTFFGTAGIVKGIFWCRDHAYSLGLPNGLAHVVSIFKLVASALGIGRDKTLMTSDPMSINVPGSCRIAGQYTSVAATTLDSLLLGIKPYAYKEPGKGGLRFSAIEAGPRHILGAMKGFITGSFGDKYIPGVHVRRSNEVRIEGTDPVTLDGEIYHPVAGKPIKLKGDRTLTFVSLK